MAHIQLVNEDQATGRLAEDYRFLSESYSRLLQMATRTPMVYRTSSPVEPYFHFGALQNRVLTNDGEHTGAEGPLPRILVNFAVAFHSSCFY